MPSPHSAVVICTRDRADDLRRTLASIEAHPPPSGLACVMDASTGAVAAANARTVAAVTGLAAVHWTYDAAPSLSRQRNAALDRLPASVDVVHFVDDDVTVRPGYFERLEGALRDRPALGGVGGVIVEPDVPRPADRTAWARRLFLLDAATPGRVLPSGHTSTAQRLAFGDAADAPLLPTDWLVGCSCSFRRSVLDAVRFDPALTGYSMLEDLDLSVRVGRRAELAVVPGAQLVHHRSPANRLSREREAEARIVHQRWFVEKNGTHPLRHLAYWWSVLGLLLAPTLASHPNALGVFRARLRGVATVLRRDHRLLHHERAEDDDRVD